MMLPIDFAHASPPFKPKYVTEETPGLDYWCEGWRRKDGTTDIFCASGGNDDVMRNVPWDKALRIVEARNAWVQLNLDLMNAT